VTWLCRLAKMTPQNYYARRSAWRRGKVDVELMLELVRAERGHQPRLGVRKLYYLIQAELKAAGVKMGRDRLFEELRKAGLLVERKPSEWPRTTHFNPNLPVFKNLIKGFRLSGRNQVWVADITYIRTQEAFMYLGLITDKWSRKIVGFHLGETLETGSPIRALAMALKGLKRGEFPILHSDRGCQYASHVYVKSVKEAGLKISMTERNHCAENALAERLNGILKQEFWLDAQFGTKPEARRAVSHGVNLYNNRRPHWGLDLKTPAMVHQTNTKN
jgi:putative transposase